MILEDLDGDDVAGAFLPALYNLTEGSTTEELENLKREDILLKCNQYFLMRPQ